MSAQPNQSIIHGIICLQTLAASPVPVGCRELARQVDLPVMTVNRILRTLMYMGMVVQNEKKSYLPGPAIHVLAAQSIHGSELMNRALPVIENYLPVNHIVSVGVLWGDKVSYLIHALPEHSFSQSLLNNHLFDVTQSTIGVMLLSRMKDEEILQLLGNERFDEVKEPIDFARINGYASRVHSSPQERTIAVMLDEKNHAAIALSRLHIRDENELEASLKSLYELRDKIIGQ
ncbi:helix-turn-helix domain-containing protein [Buttiauxella warmboldiae]|uniref:helix-turn-helix domain-containing protein n=1 Tax=Buttiauxella warmboldiae TaxID=82993 RepID=UPI00142D9C39|nr:helix-turn-helix domain-containing protein [Buttiauxella warmboldiae]